VTYGLACAPILALRTLVQLIKDEGDKYFLAIPSLTHGRYVDDIFGGADSISQAQESPPIKFNMHGGQFSSSKMDK